MANLQRQMEEFHDAIRLDGEEEVLREKRERVVHRLRDGLAKDFADRDEESPEFTHFSQGSYAMHTGVKPVEGGEYDIDVGIRFEIAKDDYPDPVEVKGWVHDALEEHTSEVVIRKPCVTVYYHEDGERAYHVDLAIYSDADSNADGRMYLARGKPSSDQDERTWEESDSLGLIDLIRERYADAQDAAQFRRVIRDFKRWKDVDFMIGGNSAPVGVALTVAAYNWFSPSKTLVDAIAKRYQYDDLAALKTLVEAMVGRFSWVVSNGKLVERLAIPMPVTPFNDLLRKMTDAQMSDLKAKLTALRDAAQSAQDKADPIDACKLLQGQFGQDFPVPSAEETGQKRARAIISSSSSA